jgi:hypothetical protein
MVACAWDPSYMGGPERSIIVQSQPQAKMWDPIWKITKAKRAGGVAQVVKHLLNKHKALSLKPSTAFKKKCTSNQ